MRKSQREITDKDEVVKLLGQCDTVRLAMNGGDFPYVVPLSFGYLYEDGKLSVYFHCAKEGKKIDLLNRDNRVCLEADILSGYVDTGRGVTADYKSVIMTGVARRVSGDEAVKGLELLLSHCKMYGYSAAECAARDVCAVYRVDVLNFSGKKRF